MRKIIAFLFLTLCLGASEVRLQVLGSGGPELTQRASSGYIVWIDGKSKLLVDCGGGTFLRFAQSGANFEDLDAILLTHNHIDHTADLVAFLKAGFFTQRSKILPIYGAGGNTIFPDTQTFLKRLLDKHGAYAYMADMLSTQSRTFQIMPHAMKQEEEQITMSGYTIKSIGVHHGIVPALAFRVDVGGKSIVFSGDTNNETKSLEAFAKKSDLLVADFAIPEFTDAIAKNLHMQPSQIATLAATSQTKHLLLSHIMQRSENQLQESLAIIRKIYDGKVSIAEDLIEIIP